MVDIYSDKRVRLVQVPAAFDLSRLPGSTASLESRQVDGAGGGKISGG